MRDPPRTAGLAIRRPGCRVVAWIPTARRGLPTLNCMSLTRSHLAQSWHAWFSNDLEVPEPRWLQWLWTAVFAIIVALCFTLLGFAINALAGGRSWTQPDAWLRWFGRNLVVSLVVSYLIHGLFALLIPLVGKDRIRQLSGPRRALFFSGIPLTGVLLGWPLGVWLVSTGSAGWPQLDSPGSYVGGFLFASVISFVFFQIFNAKAMQAQAERRALESQLRLLQAQMEPHFLFNTLANVLTLIDSDPQRARQMLESFTDYLRATLASLRTEDSTLGRELELAEACLRLLHLRMEDRLRFEIVAAEELRRAALPPLLLQPLVENAIQHGLEPKVEGGRLRIEARALAGELQISISDDGLGPQTGAARRNGNGLALASIGQRLHGLYGNDATVRIEALHPGTCATLRLPLRLATGGTGA